MAKYNIELHKQLFDYIVGCSDGQCPFESLLVEHGYTLVTDWVHIPSGYPTVGLTFEVSEGDTSLAFDVALNTLQQYWSRRYCDELHDFFCETALWRV